jgi:uncharacterized integral membrane protein
MIDAFKTNFEGNNKKAKRIKSSWNFLIIGIVLLLAFAVFFTVDTKY